jgi:hypothetical protein
MAFMKIPAYSFKTGLKDKILENRFTSEYKENKRKLILSPKHGMIRVNSDFSIIL